jgi:hypothetical protein
VGTGVDVVVGVAVGTLVAVGVGLGVSVAVGVGVAVSVAVGVALGAMVGGVARFTQTFTRFFLPWTFLMTEWHFRDGRETRVEGDALPSRGRRASPVSRSVQTARMRCFRRKKASTKAAKRPFFRTVAPARPRSVARCDAWRHFPP